MTEMISSAANPLVRRVRALTDRKHRRRESAFVVHGIQPVWQAVEAGAGIEVLLVAPELLRHRGALDMVDAQEAIGVRVARLTGELFGRISDRDGPAGLAAIVRGSTASIEDLAVPEGGLFTVPVAAAESGADFLAWAAAAGVTVAATSGRAATSCWDAAWQLPLAL